MLINRQVGKECGTSTQWSFIEPLPPKKTPNQKLKQQTHEILKFTGEWMALEIIIVNNPDSERPKSHVLSQDADPN